MENAYDTIDYKPKDKDLHVFLEEGRSGYDTPKNTNQVRMVVVKINGELYNSDNGIETEDSIRKILIEANLRDNMERLYKQIDIKFNPKP